MATDFSTILDTVQGLSAAVSGKTAVFYSGYTNTAAGDVYNSDVARACVADFPGNYYTIYDTAAGQYLESLNLPNLVEQGVISGDQEDQIWAAASKNFADQAQGNVLAFLDGGNVGDDNTFVTTEYGALLQNTGVASINGILTSSLPTTAVTAIQTLGPLSQCYDPTDPNNLPPSASAPITPLVNSDAVSEDATVPIGGSTPLPNVQVAPDSGPPGVEWASALGVLGGLGLAGAGLATGQPEVAIPGLLLLLGTPISPANAGTPGDSPGSTFQYQGNEDVDNALSIAPDIAYAEVAVGAADGSLAASNLDGFSPPQEDLSALQTFLSGVTQPLTAQVQISDSVTDTFTAQDIAAGGLQIADQQTNSDGASVSAEYDSNSEGAETAIQLSVDNPDGTSQIGNYDPDGSSVTTDYSGPNGSGMITEIDDENTDGTSEITTYNSDGSSVSTTYSGPEGTGSPVESNVTVVSQPLYRDPNTGALRSYSAIINLSQVSFAFPAERTNSYAATAQTVSISLAGGDLLAGVPVGVVYNNSESSIFSFTPATVTPDDRTDVSSISAETDVSGDHENIQIPLLADFLDGEVDFSILGNQKVYSPGTVGILVDGQPETVIDLGTFHVGDSVGPFPLTIANTAAGSLTDSIQGGGITSGPFSSSTVSGILGGEASTISVNLATDAAGSFTAGLSLFNFVSHDPDLPDEAAYNSGFEISADIQNYATTEIVTARNGPGSETLVETDGIWRLDFGTVTQYEDSEEDYVISVENSAPTQYSDWLNGTVATVGDQFDTVYSGFSDVYRGETVTLADLVPDTLHLGVNQETITLSLSGANDSGYSGTLGDQTFIISDNVVAACYRAGTRIATPRGEAHIEDLVAGNLVLTFDAETVSVKWIGHRRVDCRRHPNPQDVWPVRVCAGAFGESAPHRDLWLSPDHAVFVGDVLIPIKRLINGTSIEQVPLDEVTYYHVELEHHDLLLAEGLPAESYLDTGDRFNFENGGGPVALHPEFSARRWDTAHIWEALGCARLVVTGPELDAVRQRVNALAATVMARSDGEAVQAA